MKLIISISCVLVLSLLIPCQGKDLTVEHQDDSALTISLLTAQVVGQDELNKAIPDEVEIEKEMEKEIEMEIDLEEAEEEEIFEEEIISDEIEKEMEKEIEMEIDLEEAEEEEIIEEEIISDEIEKEMEKEIEMEIDLEKAEEEEIIEEKIISDEFKEIMRELENIFGEKDDEQIKEPTGALGSVWIVEVIIGGYQNNSTNVMDDDKGGDKHSDGSVIGHKELNKTVSDNEHEEKTIGTTETPMNYKEASINMMDDDKTSDDNSNDQKELNEAIVDEAELEKEIEIEIEMELDFDLMGQGIIVDSIGVSSVISDDEGGDDDHEGSGHKDQNETIGMESETFKEVENEIALEEDNEEIYEEIESMKIEGMNSEIKELHQEEDNIMEDINSLENNLIAINEVPAVHSANHATQNNREQIYSQSTMRLVFFISAGILMLSVLLLLIVLIVILTKKETVHGNSATRYIKRIRLISNTSTKSKEFLV